MKIRCDDHGICDMEAVCEHVFRAMLDKTHISMHRTALAWFCADCLLRHDVGDLEIGVHVDLTRSPHIADDEFNRLFEIVGYEPDHHFCFECLIARQIDMFRAQGRDLPCPIFERTLTAKHSDEIRCFIDFLTSHYPFRNSSMDTDEPAIVIKPGSLVNPLTMTVYYVVSESDQRFIWERCGDFFRNRTLNQLRIEFCDSENVSIERQTNGEILKAKGKAELSRTVNLNC